MENGVVQTAASRLNSPDDRRLYGVAVAEVVDVCDDTNLGRVQVRLAALPDHQPWARVATLMTGASRGTYFMPQVGDEVLVAGAHGDMRELYVVGSVWNNNDQSPADRPKDAVNLRIIRTPQGHEVVFDDDERTITVTSIDKQKITIDRSGIKISTKDSKASITLEASGKITLQAESSINLEAKSIKVNGTTVDLHARGSAKLRGDSACWIDGGSVNIGMPIAEDPE